MSISWKIGTAPGGLPWLGHALSLLRQPLEFLASLRGVGDIVKFRLGKEDAYWIRHPELLKHVLVTEPYTFDKGGPMFDKARLVVGNGVITCPAKDHLRQRRVMQPAFSHDRLTQYASVMRDETDTLAKSWHANQVVKINQEMQSVALAIVTGTMFSTKAPAEIVAEMQHGVPFILDEMYHRMVAPFGLLEKLPTQRNLKYEKTVARMRALVEQIIVDRRKADDDHGDIMSALLGNEQSDDRLTNSEMCDQVFALFLAGTETTASALAWAFYLLGQHPEIEKRLHDEVDAVLAGRPAKADDVPKLDYTQRIITESLRMYPPVWMLTRRTSAEVELGGLRLAPGTTVVFSPSALHRDPEFFSEPDQFDPDRWLPERAKAVPRYAMLPFSAGKRKCMGDAFATLETTIVLATLASRWRLRPITNETLQHVRPKMTLSPGNLVMRVESRQRNATT